MAKGKAADASDKAEASADAAAGDGKAGKRPGRRKLLLLVAPLLLVIGAGAAWYLGLRPGSGAGPHAAKQASGPVFVSVPEIVANLIVPPGSDSYAKMKAEIEVPNAEAAHALTRRMPRVVDVFETYLRAMHPDDLRGATGTYRLREALIRRVQAAIAPAEVTDVLFQELIVQ